MSASRRVVGALLCIACMGFVVAPSQALAATPPSPGLSVPAYTIVTIGGQRLWSHNRDTERRVASTIKMLNVLVAREHASLNETVTVSAKAARTEDGVGLVAGQKVSVRKLIQLMMVASANDAAEALAIHIAGSERAYVAMMNAKAKQLGLTHTHAVDPHGLSKREHSTARDLSVLGREVLKDPYLRNVLLMQSVVPYRPHHRPKTLQATNEMLGHYRGIEGVKTGFTYPAGYCFVGAAKRGNLELVGVVLGAHTKAARFSQMHKLLDWGFKNFRMRRLVSVTTTMGAVSVSGGDTSTVTVHAAYEASRAVLATGAVLATTITLPATVTAPVHRGDQLGVVRVTQNGKPLVAVALLADADVATAAIEPIAPLDAPAPALFLTPSTWHDRRVSLSGPLLGAIGGVIPAD